MRDVRSIHRIYTQASYGCWLFFATSATLAEVNVRRRIFASFARLKVMIFIPGFFFLGKFNFGKMFKRTLFERKQMCARCEREMFLGNMACIPRNVYQLHSAIWCNLILRWKRISEQHHISGQCTIWLWPEENLFFFCFLYGPSRHWMWTFFCVFCIVSLTPAPFTFVCT